MDIHWSGSSPKGRFQKAFGVFIALKLLLSVALLSALTYWGPEVPAYPSGIMRWPREGGPAFGSYFAAWDGAHYLLLSEVGYAEGMASCAFHPLWPLLIRTTAPAFGGSDLIAGLVVSNLFSLAAWALFYRLVARRWGPRAGLWALVFLIAFPGSLFFQFIYTESLFLLLVLGLWLGLEDRRYGLVAVCAGLLPICRGVGAFAVLPLAWHAGKVWRERGVGSRESETRTSADVPDGELRVGEPGLQGEAPGIPNLGRLPSAGDGLEGTDDGQRRVGGSGLQRVKAWLPWLLVGMPVVGWGVYLALMWRWTGNPFEGMEAQKYWGVHSISNLWNLPKFLVGFLSPTEWHAFRGSLLDRCVFVLVLYTLPVLWRLDKGLLVWTYWLAVLPAMSGTFTSFTRFASCAFPVFIALGMVLSRREWRWWRYGLLALFVVLHVVLVWRFVNFRWAGCGGTLARLEGGQRMMEGEVNGDAHEGT